jgi:uncharacterized membrane protein YdbT with pleckstrin-like domain
MGYPKRLLSEGEEIVSEFRPHWVGIIKEITLVALVLVLVVILALNDGPWWLYVVLVVAAIGFVANGLIRWFTTMHVITNERVIFRAGLISKRGKEIPHEVINDVAFSQSVIERIFGAGDLMIESAGTHGQSRYRDIPNPEAVQSLIYSARETRMKEMRRPGTATAESTASQMATLSRLHDEGKLTDAEFEAEKRKLLGDL